MSFCKTEFPSEVLAIWIKSTTIYGVILVGMINKRIVMIGAVAGMTAGGAIPLLWGDNDIFGSGSLLFGMLGGFLGIWLAVWVSKQLS